MQDEPPTEYQQWQRWFDRWNTEAGERIDYLPRSRAVEVGLLPDAGSDDWWLLDSCRLIVMRFDDGRCVERELAIVTWIERTYHRRRRQAVLGRLTPVEYEMIMTPQATQAA